MKYRLTLIFLFFQLILYSQGQSEKSYKEWKVDRFIEYFFSDSLIIENSKNSSPQLPINFYLEFSLEDLYDVEIRNNSFYSKSTTLFTVPNDSLNGDSIGDSAYFYLVHPEDDKKYINQTFERTVSDSLSQYSIYFEGPLPHKWNLRNYPFDKQQLKFVFESTLDTSFVKLGGTIPDKSIIKQVGKFENLRDGYELGEFSVRTEYITSLYKLDQFPEGERNEVLHRLTYSLELNRNGSYLYFKLFFGAFLSFLISFLVFFIDSSKFDTRITLSLGGIFGGVGNKYFVENTMPSIQILTKADLINNLIILLIIMNIFIVIGQSTDKMKLGWIESNRNAAFLSLAFLLISNYLIISYP